MSVLGLIGISWLGLNGLLVAVLLNRRSRPVLKARLFNWVIRTTPREADQPRGYRLHV